MDRQFLAKIIATDKEGLQMISACCAGSKIRTADIKFLKSAYIPLFSSGVFTVKYLVIFLFSFMLALKIPNVTSNNFKLQYNWFYAFLLAILILFSIINLNKQVSFIYFQF